MSEVIGSLVKEVRLMIRRHENKPFLRAAMAACALVADADRNISFSKRYCLDDIMETLDNLKVFDPHEGVDLFYDFVDAIRADPVAGRKQAFDAIRLGARDRATAAILMRLAIAIAAADDRVPEEEQKAIDDVAVALGINPSQHLSWVA